MSPTSAAQHDASPKNSNLQQRAQHIDHGHGVGGSGDIHSYVRLEDGEDDDDNKSKSGHGKSFPRKPEGVLQNMKMLTAKASTALHNHVIRRIPLASRAIAAFHRLPRSVKLAALLTWLLWKVVMTVLFLRIVFKTARRKRTDTGSRTTATIGKIPPSLRELDSSSLPTPFRILHIITSIDEYGVGKDNVALEFGQDRLRDLVLPVLNHTLESMLSQGWTVDVYMILGYELSADRKQFIEDSLLMQNGQVRQGIGQLDIWDDAIPIGYQSTNHTHLRSIKGALARQHRFVLKDKLHLYDFFTIFEDDMLVKAHQVQCFWDLSTEIDRLRILAEEEESEVERAAAGTTKATKEKKKIASARKELPPAGDKAPSSFYGQLSAVQLKRLIPGFISVEVVSDETTISTAKANLDSVPADFDFQPTSTSEGTKSFALSHGGAAPCCSGPIEGMRVSTYINFPTVAASQNQMAASQNQIVTWETAIRGLSVRSFPPSSSLGWVAFQPGPTNLNREEDVRSYWSGEGGRFGREEAKPKSTDPRFFAEQGGYMASRDQLLRIDEMCQGVFFPPVENAEIWNDTVLEREASFWIGGYQLFSGVKDGCNMQRIISLDPSTFANQLLYHTPNDKQREVPNDRLVTADNLLGQLHTIMKQADRLMKVEVR